jgi:hypothetical protein
VVREKHDVSRKRDPRGGRVTTRTDYVLGTVGLFAIGVIGATRDFVAAVRHLVGTDPSRGVQTPRIDDYEVR